MRRDRLSDLVITVSLDRMVKVVDEADSAVLADHPA